MVDDDGIGVDWFVEGGKVWCREVARSASGVPVELSRQTVCDAGGEMAIAYDAANGVVHKIGSREAIEMWADGMRRSLEKMAIVMPSVKDQLNPGDVRVVTFMATPEALREVTDCLARTGSGGEFAARFGQSDAPAPSVRH